MRLLVIGWVPGYGSCRIYMWFLGVVFYGLVSWLGVCYVVRLRGFFIPRFLWMWIVVRIIVGVFISWLFTMRLFTIEIIQKSVGVNKLLSMYCLRFLVSSGWKWEVITRDIHGIVNGIIIVIVEHRDIGLRHRFCGRIAQAVVATLNFDIDSVAKIPLTEPPEGALSALMLTAPAGVHTPREVPGIRTATEYHCKQS